MSTRETGSQAEKCSLIRARRGASAMQLIRNAVVIPLGITSIAVDPPPGMDADDVCG